MPNILTSTQQTQPVTDTPSSEKIPAIFMPPPRQTGKRRHNDLNLSVRPFIRLFVCPWLNSWTGRCKNEWSDFDANWYIWSTGNGMKRSTFGVWRSKVKVTRGWRQIWRLGRGIILDPLGLDRVSFLLVYNETVETCIIRQLTHPFRVNIHQEVWHVGEYRRKIYVVAKLFKIMLNYTVQLSVCKFYHYSVVTVSLSCTVSEISNVE